MNKRIIFIKKMKTMVTQYLTHWKNYEFEHDKWLSKWKLKNAKNLINDCERGEMLIMQSKTLIYIKKFIGRTYTASKILFWKCHDKSNNLAYWPFITIEKNYYFQFISSVLTIKVSIFRSNHLLFQTVYTTFYLSIYNTPFTAKWFIESDKKFSCLVKNCKNMKKYQKIQYLGWNSIVKNNYLKKKLIIILINAMTFFY